MATTPDIDLAPPEDRQASPCSTALRAVNASGFVPPAMQRLQQLVLESRELLRVPQRVAS